jgi:hypothetical protein
MSQNNPLQSGAHGSSNDRSPNEHLVAVRTDVLNDAEHALGNLFQRIYHLTRLTREGLGPHAERLNGAVENIERLLELLFDYVSPVDVELGPLAAAKVVESLTAQIRGQASCDVAAIECPPVQVIVDVKLLRRSLQLLGRAFGRDVERASRVVLDVTCDADRTEFGVHLEVAEPNSSAADAHLALAVAARLIELNGGELRHATDAAACAWRIALPTAKESHVAV